jgi:hypothetical protein
MIEKLADYDDGKLADPWKHGDKVDDAVFPIAATFPYSTWSVSDTRCRGTISGSLTRMRLSSDSSRKRVSRIHGNRSRIRLAEGDRTLSMIDSLARRDRREALSSGIAMGGLGKVRR